MARIDDLRKIATRLRIHSLRMTTASGSGHPTTCLSAADIAACLFFGEMRWNPKDPADPANDEFVLSKVHAAPLLWAAYAEAGIIPQAEQSLESAVIGYRVSTVDFLTLLDSRMTLFTYERELYDSQAEYMLKLAQLEAAVGTDLVVIPIQ